MYNYQIEMFKKWVNWRIENSLGGVLLPLTFFYALCILIPDFFNVQAPSLKGYITTQVYLFFHYLTISIIVSGIFEILSLGKVVLLYFFHILLHFVLILYSLSSCVLSILFQLQWNEITFEIIRETNRREIAGFFYSYGWDIITIIACIVFICVLEVLVLKKISFKKGFRLSIKRYLMPFFIIWSIYTLFFYFFPEKDLMMDRFYHRSSLWNLDRSFVQYRRNMSQFDECAYSQHNVSIDSVAYTSSNIILVIGESYIKHHSQLYGYYLPTNPKLSKEENLVIFDDVISSYNATSESFKQFLSLSSIDDSLKWSQAPLFPSIFKQAGYNVVFYSNQFVLEGPQGGAEASAGFMNLPSIAPMMFDHRNKHREKYDGLLVDSFVKGRDTIEAQQNNLIIFHLFGQHYPAEIQYPEELSFFSISDINRPDLTESQKLEVARYDNATRYNDFVISEIIDLWRNEDAIIIYFSDHGDEINDFRPKVGRSFDFKQSGANVLHCQFDIPFMIYYTNKYKERHQPIVQQILASVHNPFMTDDLPHLMLELAGIKTVWYNPSRSLINIQYNKERRRYINESDICYEEYCSGVNKRLRLKWLDPLD